MEFEGTVELDLYCILQAGNLPRIVAAQPIVGVLYLPTIFNRLLENPVFIAQTIAHRWQLQGRHRIEEAGCQTSQSPISQTGVGLLLEQIEPIQISVLNGILHDRVKQQVRDVIAK